MKKEKTNCANLSNRLFAFTELGYNILKSRVTRKRMPIFLSLFITNRCNLRCSYCFVVDESLSRTILNAEYTKEEIFQIIDEFYEMGMRMVFLLGGEPLVHKDISEIVDYIVNKRIYLTICTNGTLIEKKLSEVRKADVLAVSLDGVGQDNDVLRGDRTYDKAISGIRAATSVGVPCRIHAVLTRRNMYGIRDLAHKARDIGVALTISPPNFLGETDNPDLRIGRAEYKAFWAEYLEMKKEGLPIGNDIVAIKKCLNWPKDYHRYITSDEKISDYRPIFCMNGYTYVALGAEGTMYNCINLGCLNGPNIKEMGIRRAWEKLLDWRPNCVSCASLNCIETAMMLRMRLGPMLGGLRFHVAR